MYSGFYYPAKQFRLGRFRSIIHWLQHQIQSFQHRRGIIHCETMTKKAYWNAFLKMDMDADDWTRQERYLQSRDQNKARAGKDEYDFNPF